MVLTFYYSTIFYGYLEPDASTSKTLLEKASKAEKAVQAERIQMQQVIDTKQRLIEKQVITNNDRQ